jgi:hypothetical protein
MRGQRFIRASGALVLLVLLASVIAPAGADANSLLSGYGGPGQGNQAILGAALVGGGAGGGAGSSGGGGSGGEASAGLAAIEAKAGGSGSAEGGSRSGGAGRGGGGTAATGHHGSGRASAGSARAYQAPRGVSTVSTSQARVGSSPALGLTGADVAYILLALGVLILTAVMTRRLARQPG